ncbi:GD25472 [Drosophila simulans]|uniref:GD25472 n=1 Tax=Drosophila simulans TaxID=7240 RepID=B4QAV1_DROSI|nr:GD25472 [Drosophila simulans]
MLVAHAKRLSRQKSTILAIFASSGWIGGSAEHYLIATGDDRGIRIGFSAFWGRAIEVAPKKKCLEFGEFGEFSTSRRVHCKPSSSTDRSTDQANITQPRMKSAKKSGMEIGMKSKKPKKPRTTRRSDSLLPEELQRFQFQFPLPVDTHTLTHPNGQTDTDADADADTDLEPATCVNPWSPKLVLQLVIGNS